MVLKVLGLVISDKTCIGVANALFLLRLLATFDL
jgi:hypothetical protein